MAFPIVAGAAASIIGGALAGRGGGVQQQTDSISQIGVAENQQQYLRQIADIDKQIAELNKKSYDEWDAEANPRLRRSLSNFKASQIKKSKELEKQKAELQKLATAAPVSAQESQALAAQTKAFGDIQSFVNRGPGAQEVSAALGSQRSFAQMLNEFSQGGFLPGQQDWAQANMFTQQAFAPQQEQMNQFFQEQNMMGQRQGAIMGRGVNDPVMRAKLAQEQARQQSMLGAQQTAFGSQFALSLPQQRLQFAGMEADQRGQLAQQAMANRQLISGMGNSIREQERNYRLNIASKVNAQGIQQSNQPSFMQQAGAGLGFGSMVMDTDWKKLFGGGSSSSGGSGSGGSSSGGFQQPNFSQQFGTQMPSALGMRF